MKHFLSVADYSSEEIWKLLRLARDLKAEWQAGGNEPLLKGKVLGMIFQKPSLRTRVSFEVGMQHLGGTALYLSPNEIQLGKRESVADVARVLSRYVQGIMARVFSHRDVEQLAAHGSVPVINGLSDYSHPCQAMGDILTAWEKLGDLRGRKLVFVGDGNNVANSLLFVCARVGMDVAVASPAGYEPHPGVVTLARRMAAETGSQIEIGNDPAALVRDADVIYTDVWASMGQEAEAELRKARFAGFQINESLVSLARPEALVMHCLPAHRGEEITDGVADGPNSALFDEAENRLHAQKAILVALMAPQRAGF
ncbi:MAG: ornithine carbamoyltransferase [Anaerolineae bacterium]|jgi:ornithine carbamoyltransferase|nr:ornithine carbamoyltransferase [Anaerolineae bacterium]